MPSDSSTGNSSEHDRSRNSDQANPRTRRMPTLPAPADNVVAQPISKATPNVNSIRTANNMPSSSSPILQPLDTETVQKRTPSLSFGSAEYTAPARFTTTSMQARKQYAMLPSQRAPTTPHIVTFENEPTVSAGALQSLNHVEIYHSFQIDTLLAISEYN